MNYIQNNSAPVAGVDHPAILITSPIKKKLDAYITVAPGEIAGLGIVSMPRPNIFLIDDVFILRQTANGSEANLDPRAVHEMMLDWIEEGKDISTIKLQWHSHANFGVFWSVETDIPNIEAFGNGENEWMLSLVGNKHGEFLARLDIFIPFRVTFDRLALTVVNTIDEAALERARLEVSQKVQFIAPPPVKVFKGNAKISGKVRVRR